MGQQSSGAAKRLSNGLSHDTSKSDDDGTAKIVDYRGVSVQKMLETQKAVEDGTLAPGVRLVVAKVKISSEMKKGATIKLSGAKKWNGKLTGTVAYVAGSVAFRAKQVREKPRSEWTTEDVAAHVVLAATAAKKCIYLDVVEQEEDVGEEYQGAFVSQARSCRFVSLVEALVAHYEKKGFDLHTQFVWLDVFSANQPLLTSQDSDPRVQQERYDLLTHGLHVAIDKFDECVIFFDTWNDPKPLGRAWCVWEIYGSIKHGRPVQPVFAPGQDQAFLEVLLRDVDEITQAFADIDTRNAACFSAEDKAMIDGAVKEQLQDGYTTLNAVIFGSVRDLLTGIAHAAVARAKNELAEDDEEAQVEYARVLHQAGFFLKDQAKHEESLAYYEEALAYYEEALSITKAKLGEQHPEVATTLNNIAMVYKDQGRYEEALAYYEEDLRISKQALGEQHPNVATTLHNIALVYDSQGRYEEALVYFEEALVYFEEALGILKAKLGEQHPNVATTLVGIALVYDSQGRYEEALAYFEEALGILKAKLGEKHPHVATSRRRTRRRGATQPRRCGTCCPRRIRGTL